MSHRRFSLVLNELPTAAVYSCRRPSFSSDAISCGRLLPDNVDIENRLHADPAAAESHTRVAVVPGAQPPPTLPRRDGLRNTCILCVVLLWMCVVLCVTFSYPEFTAALRASRNVAFNIPTMPSRNASERNHCTFSVLASVGRPSRLQLVVELAWALTPSVEEDDIVISQYSPGFFEVDVACCTADIFRALENPHGGGIHRWNSHLWPHYGSSVILSRAVAIEQRPHI
jgi:hypothetical protein